MKIGLAFKPREEITAISDEYVITVSRPDGNGLTPYEVEAVLQSFMEGHNASLEKPRAKRLTGHA